MSQQRIRSVIILIGIVLCSMAAWFAKAQAGAGTQVLVTVGGQNVQRFSLSVDASYRIETQSGYNVVSVQNGQVSVTEADCANKICVRSGSISESGEVIACLPHKVVVTITASSGEVDTVAY